MKNTNEVIDAVRDGSECSDEELRYAVRNLSIWQNQAIFPIARAVTENPMTERTKRDLNRCFESAKVGNATPLDVRLKGGSFEPGLTKAERTDRMVESTSGAAMKLIKALSPTHNPDRKEATATAAIRNRSVTDKG